jgi:hypothetical protein
MTPVLLGEKLSCWTMWKIWVNPAPHMKLVLAMMKGSQKVRFQKPIAPTRPMPIAAKASYIWKPLFRGQPMPRATSSA